MVSSTSSSPAGAWRRQRCNAPVRWRDRRGRRHPRLSRRATAQFALLRLTAAGVPDTSFSSDGEVTTEFAGGNAEADAVTVLPDGTIVAVGELDTVAGSEFAIARYDADGTLLWQTTTQFAEGAARGADVVIEPNRIVAIGTVDTPSGSARFALAGYTPAGDLDPTFGNGGTQVTAFVGGDALGRGACSRAPERSWSPAISCSTTGASGSRSRATPPTASSTSRSRPRAGHRRRSARATRSGPTLSRSPAGRWSSAASPSNSASAIRRSHSPGTAPTGRSTPGSAPPGRRRHGSPPTRDREPRSPWRPATSPSSPGRSLEGKLQFGVAAVRGVLRHAAATSASASCRRSASAGTTASAAATACARSAGDDQDDGRAPSRRPDGPDRAAMPDRAPRALQGDAPPDRAAAQHAVARREGGRARVPRPCPVLDRQRAARDHGLEGQPRGRSGRSWATDALRRAAQWAPASRAARPGPPRVGSVC